MDISLKKIKSYIRRAEIVAENSPDEQTKVGSVLISSRTLSVISEGYNGFIRGANDAALPKTRPGKYEYIIHAEANLICNAARNGVDMNECFIVQTHSPCVNCARLLFQAGIDVIYFKDKHVMTDTAERLGDLTFNYTDLKEYSKLELKPNK